MSVRLLISIKKGYILHLILLTGDDIFTLLNLITSSHANPSGTTSANASSGTER